MPTEVNNSWDSQFCSHHHSKIFPSPSHSLFCPPLPDEKARLNTLPYTLVPCKYSTHVSIAFCTSTRLHERSTGLDAHLWKA